MRGSRALPPHRAARARSVVQIRASSHGDQPKDRANCGAAHGLGFAKAQEAFLDPHRLIFADAGHGGAEERYFCLGMIGDRVMTVRFTWRDGRIRLFGAGYWRKAKEAL